ncbi:MAG: ComF family protein [Ruminococcaceae bacterium]|nr:ComF family protein [Oscillospiraceae bacterium]
MKFMEVIADLLFPPRCTFCKKLLKRGESGICSVCINSLPYNTWTKAPKIEFIEDFVAPLKYEGSVRDALLRYKFKGVTVYARTFAKLVAKSVSEELKGKYDIISWVPLSSERLRQRGYDQAMLIAMACALELDDVAVETLKKCRDTDPQSGKGEISARRANISGAYEVADAELIAGKRILLIDDVVTTGATVSECARMLKLGGAEAVLCAAVAYSGN